MNVMISRTVRNEDQSWMNSSIVNEAGELAGWTTESEAVSVSQALMQLTDKWGKKGKRYS